MVVAQPWLPLPPPNPLTPPTHPQPPLPHVLSLIAMGGMPTTDALLTSENDSTKQVSDELKTMLLAGHETSASSVICTRVCCKGGC